MNNEIMTSDTLYELCKALGIIPDGVDRVYKFTLTAEVGRPPELEVWYRPTMPHGEPTTKRFQVTEVE